MNRDWVNEQGHRTKKTPTSLLLKPDLSFDSFGYKAEEKYCNLKNVYEETEYWFFQHFKMCLHNDRVRREEEACKQTTTSLIFSGSNADTNYIH